MIFKILIKKVSNIVYKILLLHVYRKARYKKILFRESSFIIITIAFNNIDILKTQHKYLKENLEDNFNHIIADNSNNKEKSDEIRLFCEKNGSSYIKLPKNPLTGVRASGSHGIALNWCYRNIIKKYKPKYFGFLDHDVFPIKKTCIITKIIDGFWGVVRTKKEKWWYLWPGFSFYEYAKVKKYKFNFFPHHAGFNSLVFLDTGGSNYYSIFRKVNRSSIAESKSRLIDLNTEKEFVMGDDSRNTFEIIDNEWLHIRQISWREESFSKISKENEIIDVASKITSAN